MLAFLDGSGSTFETGRVSPHTPYLTRLLRRLVWPKGVAGVTQNSAYGVPK